MRTTRDIKSFSYPALPGGVLVTDVLWRDGTASRFYYHLTHHQIAAEARRIDKELQRRGLTRV